MKMSETQCIARCGNLTVEGSKYCEECGMPSYTVETLENDPRIYGATHDVEECNAYTKDEFVNDVNYAIENAVMENNEPDERKGEFKVWISSDGGAGEEMLKWEFEVDLKKYKNGETWSWSSVEPEIREEYAKRLEYTLTDHYDGRYTNPLELEKIIKELDEKHRRQILLEESE